MEKNIEGKSECSKCEGRGYIVTQHLIYRCDKCGGRKKLDWLEQVIGRRQDIPIPQMEELIEDYKRNVIAESFLKRYKEDSIIHRWMECYGDKT